MKVNTGVYDRQTSVKTVLMPIFKSNIISLSLIVTNKRFFVIIF